ncbi:methylphosphotriester-DNA alkyltransferase [Planococcus antarcticus DSM 14505]|uniref:Adenosine deaminase n=1 Tax=Planococcus antarcticus DSM 14505 TaxID=1185653 RepID=A0A1C7DDI8_9BACL|nr:Ada metal-binding domain-containing protein [Planococcus antarcticus]ANU09589.1 adenosine deaminase [Planococcus antarcticus DSM 14505]EIM08205.1 methylphosphotriester-DNA alkyltransferase [Planococcus antarcticus DSM 14505]
MEKISFSFDEMWKKVMACDRKYDGLFYTAVKTTKIFCRPSCRSRKPKKINVDFYSTIEEAEARGFRACKRCQPETEYSPDEELTRKVMAFLAGNYRENISLQDMANHVGMSPSYLERVFKQETSETPHSSLEKIRIDKAVQLLKRTSLSNLEVCFETGFQSPSNFYKIFLKIKAHSPYEFRKLSEPVTS